MNSRAEFVKRKRELNTSKALFFKEIVKLRFRDLPKVYYPFNSILSKYGDCRIEYGDMYQQLSKLLWDYPVIFRGFFNSLPQSISTKDDDVETPRTDKKAKIEGRSSKAIPVASCSSSSPSGPGNAAQAYEAQKKETAQSGRRTLYVTRTKPEVINESAVYEHILVLVNQIRFNRFDTYTMMEYVSDEFRGHSNVIENFNIFLPDGFKIVVVPDVKKMITN